MTEIAATAYLTQLEEEVVRALRTDDDSHLTVLGYGEISTVILYFTTDEEVACKRLPLFDNRDRFESYGRIFERYLDRLGEVGVEVVPSRLSAVEREDGRLAVYCVQPRLESRQLMPVVLREASVGEGIALFDELLDRFEGAVSEGLGLDCQLSNWARCDGRLVYLDVTTPLMRDESGRELLDVELFLASLPAFLRAIVRRFMMSAILDKYYSLRGVVLDFLGNLIKEGLNRWIPTFLARANRRLERTFSLREVERYYRSDARMWALLQRVRRLDRIWQRKIRRRPYPFLLPGRIERNV